jgi:uncharacterized protein YjbI with pentapeptide repeats
VPANDTRPLGTVSRFRRFRRRIWRLLREQSSPLQTISALIAMITIVWGVGQYLWTKAENDALQRTQAHYSAWLVVNSAQGQAVSGGRIDALEYLAREKVHLSNLSAPNAQLDRINLAGAFLDGADLTGVSMWSANLDGTYMSGASLKGANLVHTTFRDAMLGIIHSEEWTERLSFPVTYVWEAANLEGADLRVADLSYAYLPYVNFTDSSLAGAQLRGAQAWSAKFNSTNLRESDLSGANLRNSSLLGANLTGAYVKDANFSDADVQGAIFIGTHDLLPEQIMEATNWQLAYYDPILHVQLALPGPVVTPTPLSRRPPSTLTPAP